MVVLESRVAQSSLTASTAAACCLVVLSLLAECAPAQTTPPETLPTTSAAFAYAAGPAAAPTRPAADAPVDPSAWNLGVPAPAPSAQYESEPDVEQLISDAWILNEWSPPIDDEDGESGGDLAITPIVVTVDRTTSSRMDAWSRGVFSRDAEQLTPLTKGRSVVAWHVADGITLSGVGSRRVWDDRNRSFVLSAEAGFDLSPGVGFQLGYEVLQASAVSTAGSEGESLFARLQLRF